MYSALLFFFYATAATAAATANLEGKRPILVFGSCPFLPVLVALVD